MGIDSGVIALKIKTKRRNCGFSVHLRILNKIIPKAKILFILQNYCINHHVMRDVNVIPTFTSKSWQAPADQQVFTLDQVSQIPPVTLN